MAQNGSLALKQAGTPVRCPCLAASDEFVDEVLQEFLAAACVRGGIALFEDVGFEPGKIGLALFDLSANAGVPRSVALLHKFRETAVLANGRGDLESAREGVHAADVRVKKVDGFKAFASYRGVEIHAAGFQAAVFQNRQHGLGGEIDARGKLVRVPTEQF